MEEQVLEAIRYFETGNKQEAQKQLALVLKENPEHEYAWLWLSMTMDDPAKQEALLQKVLEINPQNAKANQLLHRLAFRNGTYTNDVTDVDTAIETGELFANGTSEPEPAHASDTVQEANEGISESAIANDGTKTELPTAEIPEETADVGIAVSDEALVELEIEPIREDEDFETAVFDNAEPSSIDATLLVTPELESDATIFEPFDAPEPAPLPDLPEFAESPFDEEIPTSDNDISEADERVFQTTLDPYSQAETETQTFNYSKTARTSSDKRSQQKTRKFLVVVGAVVFASILYLAAVSLLFNNDDGSPVVVTEPDTATATVVAIVEAVPTDEPTEEPEPTEEAVVIPTNTTVPPTAEPTSTPEPTIAPTETAVPPTPTAEPTAVSPTATPATTSAGNNETYLAAAQELLPTLEGSFLEILDLASSIDFTDDDWLAALNEQATIVNTVATNVEQLAPTSDLTDVHELLQTTAGNCQTGTNFLVQGAEQEQVETMQSAAPFLADCRDGINRLDNLLAG